MGVFGASNKKFMAAMALHTKLANEKMRTREEGSAVPFRFRVEGGGYWSCWEYDGGSRGTLDARTGPVVLDFGELA